VAADLRDISHYIAKDDVDRAVTFVAELLDKCHAIADRPRIGRLRPELGESVRSRAYRGYVILYRIEPERIRVLRIVHGARDIERLLS
jgi:toxin ParE1/3/4